MTTTTVDLTGVRYGFNLNPLKKDATAEKNNLYAFARALEKLGMCVKYEYSSLNHMEGDPHPSIMVLFPGDTYGEYVYFTFSKKPLQGFIINTESMPDEYINYLYGDPALNFERVLGYFVPGILKG